MHAHGSLDSRFPLALAHAVIACCTRRPRAQQVRLTPSPCMRHTDQRTHNFSNGPSLRMTLTPVPMQLQATAPLLATPDCTSHLGQLSAHARWPSFPMQKPTAATFPHVVNTLRLAIYTAMHQEEGVGQFSFKWKKKSGKTAWFSLQ